VSIIARPIGILLVVIALAACAETPPRTDHPEPSASSVPSPPNSPQPSPTAAAEVIEAGTLAVVTGAAAVLEEPGGRQWAVLEPDHYVLIIDVVQDRLTEWYRIEFEFCCSAEYSAYEWVFGWVAADLETAGLADPGWGIPPAAPSGPTLQAAPWTCPESAEELYRVAEPVRHTCFDEPVTFRGVLGGGFQGEALYPGEPAFITDLPNADLLPTGMDTGYRVLPLHLPSDDPLLLAWLNDERVTSGEAIEVTGAFGPGPVACAKRPRVEGLPPMSDEEAQLWCDQQFVVAAIAGEGPDPVVDAPLADPSWAPPPGTQPSSGEGWRLVASSTRNQLAVTVGVESVSVAMDHAEIQRLWLSQARGDVPVVDVATEFVVQFVPPVSVTCPWIAFTGIGVDAEQNLVYGEYERLDASLFIGEVPDNSGCTTDATPHAFLVVVDRSLAPAPEFRLRLREERLCDGCGITWDEIVVKLGE
jgi:hypothetical protein